MGSLVKLSRSALRFVSPWVEMTLPECPSTSSQFKTCSFCSTGMETEWSTEGKCRKASICSSIETSSHPSWATKLHLVSHPSEALPSLMRCRRCLTRWDRRARIIWCWEMWSSLSLVFSLLRISAEPSQWHLNPLEWLTPIGMGGSVRKNSWIGSTLQTSAKLEY